MISQYIFIIITIIILKDSYSLPHRDNNNKVRSVEVVQDENLENFVSQEHENLRENIQQHGNFTNSAVEKVLEDIKNKIDSKVEEMEHKTSMSKEDREKCVRLNNFTKIMKGFISKEEACVKRELERAAKYIKKSVFAVIDANKKLHNLRREIKNCSDEKCYKKLMQSLHSVNDLFLAKIQDIMRDVYTFIGRLLESIDNCAAKQINNAKAESAKIMHDISNCFVGHKNYEDDGVTRFNLA